MNTEEMNLALAKWMGWKRMPELDYLANKTEGQKWQHMWAQTDRCFEESELPNYCNDLNAIRQVEEKLTEEQWTSYSCFWLPRVTGANLEGWQFQEQPKLIHATAAQKAEALVRALGLEGK